MSQQIFQPVPFFSHVGDMGFYEDARVEGLGETQMDQRRLLLNKKQLQQQSIFVSDSISYLSQDL